MENQPTDPIGQPNQPPQAPTSKPKGRLFMAGAVVLGVVIVAVIITLVVMVMHKNKSTTDIVDNGTHTVAKADDLKFGQNRAVNACNVMSSKAVEATYGKLSGNTLVQEQYQTGDVDNNLISEENGAGQFSCFREATQGADTITLNLIGFRSSEAARKFYEKNADDLTRKAYDQQSISGLQAKGGVQDPNAEIIGVHNNYQYEFKYTGTIDAQTLTKLTAVAKQTVKNMDDTGISTRPASVPRVTVAGKVVPDTCELFTPALFEQQVIARDKDITAKYPFAQKASVLGVQRAYLVQVSAPATEPVAQTGPSCGRKNGTRPQAVNLSASESLARINDELLIPKINTTVQLQFDNSVEQAQRSLQAYSKNSATPVSGIGDEAYFSGAGASGELTQLIVRKGTVLMTIQTQTDGGSCRNNGSTCNATADDYVPLAKAMVSKLP